MVIYSTTPVGAIVGVCEVDGVWVATPAAVWRKYAAVAGIARSGFAAYYTDRQHAVAIKVGKTVRFASPLPLSSVGERRPPQSFRYLRRFNLRSLLAAATAISAGVHVASVKSGRSAEAAN
jgi:predicted transcriptional regulator